MKRPFRVLSQKCVNPRKANVSGRPIRAVIGEVDMARGEQRSNREKKKPKKEKIKTIAAAPSQKGAAAGWQPNLASGKKK